MSAISCLFVLVLIPVCMGLSFPVSCSKEFQDRINKRFGGTQNRSAFIVEVVTKELDRLDALDIEMKIRDRLLTDKVIPEVRKQLKKYEYDQILVMWNGTQEDRNELRGRLTVKVSDDDLKRSLHEVMKDYE